MMTMVLNLTLTMQHLQGLLLLLSVVTLLLLIHMIVIVNYHDGYGDDSAAADDGDGKDDSIALPPAQMKREHLFPSIISFHSPPCSHVPL